MLKISRARFAFWKRARWSTTSYFMNTKGAAIVSIIPLLGYFVLWSDISQELFSYSKHFEMGTWLSLQQRLYFLYIGSIIVLFSRILWWWKCPHIIKRHPECEAFVSKCMSSSDRSQAKLASATVRASLSKRNEFPQLSMILNGLVDEAVGALSGPEHKVWFSDQGREHMSVLLRTYYEIEDVMSVCSRVITFAAWALGALCFLIPSAEVFFMVLRKILL